MNWLALSIVLSIALTVILNVAVRAFPNSTDRVARRVDDWAASEGSSVRVYFPWKTMLIGSIVLTVLLNILVRL